MEQHLLAISLKAVLDYCDSYTYYSQTGYKPLMRRFRQPQRGTILYQQRLYELRDCGGRHTCPDSGDHRPRCSEGHNCTTRRVIADGWRGYKPRLHERRAPAGFRNGERNPRSIRLISAESRQRPPASRIRDLPGTSGHQCPFRRNPVSGYYFPNPQPLSKHNQTAEGWVGTLRY